MKFLKKKEKKLLEKAEETQKDENLRKQMIQINKEIAGYFNQETLLKSEGVVTRNLDTSLIFLSLLDKVRISMYALFEYVGLPEEIPQYMIENLLFDQNCCFFELGGKYYVSKYADRGVKDAYNQTVKIAPVLLNGRTLSPRTVGTDIVIIKNSFTDFSTYATIKPLLMELTQTFEGKSQAVKNSMIRWLMITQDKDKNLKAVLQRLMNNSGSVATVEMDFTENVKQFPFYEKLESKPYWEDFTNTYDFMYNLLGIEGNPNNDKKERLIVDEVNIEQTKVNMILKSMYKSRKLAVDQINKIFGLGIKIQMFIDTEHNEEKEVPENETVDQKNLTE